MSERSNPSPNALRIMIDTQAAGSLHDAIGKLKAANPHLRLSPSRVVSAIVARYIEKHFTDDAENLAQTFFDSKEYLAAELPNVKTDEELKEILAKALAGLTPKTAPTAKRGKKAAPSQDAGDHD
jgi:hypothetical protein